MDRLPNLPVHPAAELLGDALKVAFKRGGRQLENRWLIPIKSPQLGLEGRLALLGSP